ncbi:LysR family transcriptional regulator [Nitrospirillum sp. BR 11828]|uniref:LysR family transcriptional regulator n=1 Tax=Nitrospirillum sp. BR 11828 TaxID=3104325 RepID=UPI002ACA2AC6|nr:LysR family transcriptional regulator [Nitrospirillum sp. BR 11828]MDZ5649736.1 LysR family transcriptional regulator [Nitrospirillum sp. BR 11828]
MNITKLERLIAVFEAGSFRKASQGLGMSQPALTWSIKQLEDSLNTRLFERGPRGIRPTAMCERLMVRAKLIVSEHHRLVAEIDSGNKSQVITVGVHPIILNGDFARCAARFSQQEKDVTLKIKEGYSSQLLDSLQRGEIDFAYCAFTDRPLAKEGFDFEPVATQEYSVIAHPAHPIFAELAAGQPVGDHVWARVDIPNLVAPDRNANEITQLLETFGYRDTTRTVFSSSMGLLKLLVQEGGLLAMIADEFVAEEVAAGHLARVPGSRIAASSIGLLTLTGSYETAATRRFKSVLRQSHRRTNQRTRRA